MEWVQLELNSSCGRTLQWTQWMYSPSLSGGFKEGSGGRPPLTSPIGLVFLFLCLFEHKKVILECTVMVGQETTQQIALHNAHNTSFRQWYGSAVIVGQETNGFFVGALRSVYIKWCLYTQLNSAANNTVQIALHNAHNEGALQSVNIKWCLYS